MKSIWSKVKEIDLFSSQIGLHMNKSFYFKTQVGGAASILVIVFIVLFFWSRIGAFLNQEDVTVISNRIYNPDPPSSYAGTSRFMFALRIFQVNRDFVTRPYFNITISQGVYELVDGGQTRTAYSIKLEPCTPEHWEQMKTPGNFTELFSSFGSDYLCPVIGQDFYMKGMFSSQKFMFLDIKVTPCVTPNDPTQTWNPVCAPAEEVDRITERDGYHGMNIYHSNYVLNPDSSTSPYTPYINDKLFFTFVPNKMTTLCDIYFQDLTLKTDTSLLPYSRYEEIQLLSQENNDVRETVQLQRTDGVYVELFLRLSPYVSVVNRSFKKISQLMSELGGFIQIVFTCVGVMIVRYNSFKFIVDLANNLYTFEKTDEQLRKEEQQKQINEETNKKNTKKDKITALSGGNNDQQISSKRTISQGCAKDDSANWNKQTFDPSKSPEKHSKSKKEIMMFHQDYFSKYKYSANSQNEQVSPYNTPQLRNKHLPSIDYSHEIVNGNNNNLPFNTNNQQQQQPFQSPNNNSNNSSFIRSSREIIFCQMKSQQKPEDSSEIIEQLGVEDIQSKRDAINIDSKQSQSKNPVEQTSESSSSEKPISRMKSVVKDIISKSAKYIAYEKQERLRKQELSQFSSMQKQNKMDYLIKEFNKIIMDSSKLRIGFQYFLSKLSLSRFFNSETNQYIERATQLIHTDLDICNILDKIQQIDKLKTIIFDHQQLMLFNFYQKPKIQLKQRHLTLSSMGLQAITKKLLELKSNKKPLSSKNQKKGVLSEKIVWNSVESYKERDEGNIKKYYHFIDDVLIVLEMQKLYNSYVTIKRNKMAEKETFSKVNSRLIECLGQDVLSVFELSQMMDKDKKDEDSLLFQIEDSSRKLSESPNKLKQSPDPFRKFKNLDPPTQDDITTQPKIVSDSIFKKNIINSAQKIKNNSNSNTCNENEADCDNHIHKGVYSSNDLSDEEDVGHEHAFNHLNDLKNPQNSQRQKRSFTEINKQPTRRQGKLSIEKDFSNSKCNLKSNNNSINDGGTLQTPQQMITSEDCSFFQLGLPNQDTVNKCDSYHKTTLVKSISTLNHQISHGTFTSLNNQRRKES